CSSSPALVRTVRTGARAADADPRPASCSAQSGLVLNSAGLRAQLGRASRAISTGPSAVRERSVASHTAAPTYPSQAVAERAATLLPSATALIQAWTSAS